jgi:UDP-4-amino-4,6-dideoxy-N-acetyl-beta-L-altrosamine N-acetyltransferase
VRAWRNQPDVRRWMYTDHEIGPSEHQSWFESMLQDPRSEYFIIGMVEGGQTLDLGVTHLVDMVRAHGRTSWGIYLAEARARGKGLGAWVIYQMLERAFVHHGLNKVCCEALQNNEAAWKLYLAMGFKEEARLRAHILREGARLDVIGLGILREEWMERRAEAALGLRSRGLPTEA